MFRGTVGTIRPRTSGRNGSGLMIRDVSIHPCETDLRDEERRMDVKVSHIKCLILSNQNRAHGSSPNLRESVLDLPPSTLVRVFLLSYK